MKLAPKLTISLGVATVLVLLAGASTWGYYSGGSDYYIALALTWPMIAATTFSSGGSATVIALAIYYLCSVVAVNLVYALSTVIRQPRRAMDAQDSQAADRPE